MDLEKILETLNQLDADGKIEFHDKFILNDLFIHKDILLDQTTGSSSKDMFLKLVFNQIVTSSGESKLQRELIDLAVNKGANIATAMKEYYPSLEFLADNKEILLNDTKNSLSADSFLKLVLNRKEAYSDKEIKLQSDLLGFAINKGADITTAMEERNSNLKFLADNKEILLNKTNNSLSADSFLKLALQHDPGYYTSGDYLIDAEKLKLIYELVDAALSKGANINNILFAKHGYG